MPEKWWFLRLKNVIFFKNLDCFLQLKMCCGSSFGFRNFSKQYHTTKRQAIDWVNQEDYFCILLCDNQRSTKFSKAKWITTTHFQLWKTTKILERYEIFEPQNSPFLRRLMFEKNFVFWISEKTVGDNPHNVYIFWKAWPRPFQNRFDNVHTTFLYHSTAPRFRIVI